MGWDDVVVSPKIRRKEGLKKALLNADRFEIIHITGHGRSNLLSTASGGEVTIKEFREYFTENTEFDEIWLDHTRLLVNSVCDGGRAPWVRFVLGELKVRNYVAPMGTASMAEGIAVPLQLYLGLWGKKLTDRSILKAWTEAAKSGGARAWWQLFPLPGLERPNHSPTPSRSGWSP